MKVFNTDTNEVVELFHANHDTDVMVDICGGMVNWKYDEENQRYETDQQEIDWWLKWIAGDERVCDMFESIEDELLSGVAREIIEDCGAVDLGDQPAMIIGRLVDWADGQGKIFRFYGDGSIGFDDKETTPTK